MRPVRLIGDVHGKFAQYERVIKDGPPSIQVGDMGVGFRSWPHGEWRANPPYDKMLAGGHRFIRGNHDNPGVCKRHSQYIADGTVEGDVMFVGGAVSIDKAWRTPDYSWWEDEECSQEELDAIVERYLEAKPRVMITHETPEEVAPFILEHGGIATKLDPRFGSRTRVAFQRMWTAHQPELWVHGHWHVSFDRTLSGTRFVCLAELEYIDVEI